MTRGRAHSPSETSEEGLSRFRSHTAMMFGKHSLGLLAQYCCQSHAVGPTLCIPVTMRSCRHDAWSTMEKRHVKRDQGAEHINLGCSSPAPGRRFTCLQVLELGVLPKVWTCKSAERWGELVTQRFKGQG